MPESRQAKRQRLDAKRRVKLERKVGKTDTDDVKTHLEGRGYTVQEVRRKPLLQRIVNGRMVLAPREEIEVDLAPGATEEDIIAANRLAKERAKTRRNSR